MRGEKNLDGSEFQQEMPCLAVSIPTKRSINFREPLALQLPLLEQGGQTY